MRHETKIWHILFVLVAVLACVVLTTGCASSGRLSQPAAVPEVVPGFLPGYLPGNALPNSFALIPPPPAAGSAALAYDEEISRKALTLRGTPRWTLANEDANIMFPQAAGTFSCALNTPITQQDTPHLYMLLRRTLSDAALSTYTAKDHYHRTRPFVVNKEPICTTDEGKSYIKGGSYPSGHTATGWAWALILSEISPEQTEAILARGRAFGEGRVICNVHWQSDVIEGRFMGAATVARLHADPTFRADLEAAEAELAAVRSKGLKPLRDCAAEAAAMAFGAIGADLPPATRPPRFPQLTMEQLNEQQRPLGQQIMKVSSVGLGGPYNPLLRSPVLGQRMFDLLYYLRWNTSVPLRLNEFAILITGRLWRSQVEWFAHAPLAIKAGLAPEIVADLKANRRPTNMKPDEAVVYDFVMELSTKHQVSDETFDRAKHLLGEQQVVDLTAVTGTYVTIAMLLAMAEESVPPGKEPPFKVGEP